MADLADRLRHLAESLRFAIPLGEDADDTAGSLQPTLVEAANAVDLLADILGDVIAYHAGSRTLVIDSDFSVDEGAQEALVRQLVPAGRIEEYHGG